MRFKADENLPASATAALRAAGHDVRTVLDEALGGAADPDVLAACRSEGRALVTLDKDLTDVRAYPPAHFPGIIVLRPADQQAVTIAALVRRAALLLATEPLTGALWIVDARRVRIRH
jgi:predicted nuclease of predicted toxin-antitoxin system